MRNLPRRMVSLTPAPRRPEEIAMAKKDATQPSETTPLRTPVDPLEDPDKINFQKNPYSCDWRADKKATRMNR